MEGNWKGNKREKKKGKGEKKKGKGRRKKRNEKLIQKLCFTGGSRYSL